jgi:uncharacterized protein (TIGR03067 family)
MCTRLLLAVAVVGFAPNAWGQKAKEEQKMLDGSWVPVAAELGGQKLTLQSMKLVLAGDKYRLLSKDVVADQGTIAIDPEKRPRAMDIKGEEGPNKGKTFPAIYEIKGDTLTICYDLSGKQRPTEFKTAKDTKLFLATYKRAQP